MLDVELFGLNANGHHFTSLLLHALNSLLVFVLFRQMTGATWRSALAAALFALHPLRVESVAWVAERKDVLSAFFGLLALMAYAKYAQYAGPQTTDHGPQAQGGKRKAELRLDTSPCPLPGRGGEGGRAGVTAPSSVFRPLFSGWYWLALLCFALGLMSKPMLVTWPFVMLLLDCWPLNRVSRFQFRLSSWKPLIIEKLPFFALTLASCSITFLIQQKAGATSGLERLSLIERAGNALVAYARYLGKSFWPADLAAYYPHPVSWPIWYVTAAAAVIVAATMAVLWAGRQRGFLWTGWFWFIGTLVPVIGLVQVGSQSMADRYTYIPSIGLFVALVWILADTAERCRWNARPVAIGSSAVLLLLGAVTYTQAGYWQNSEKLFRHTLEVTQDNYIGHLCLGNTLIQRGQLTEGRQHLERARELNPTLAQIHGALASLAVREGRYADGIAGYREALKHPPTSAEVLNNLAWLLATCPEAEFRNGAEAVQLGEQACALTGYERPIYIGTLAAAYAETGRFTDAIATAQRAQDRAQVWGEDALARRNLELMELYRSGKAFHEVRPP